MRIDYVDNQLCAILGIDPGLNTTGYGVLDFVGRQPTLGRGRRRPRQGERLRSPSGSHEIHDGVADVIATLKPEVLAIEELYSHYDRPTTAILMGHARGVIVLAAAQAGIPVAQLPVHADQKNASPATATPPSGKCRKRSAASSTCRQIPEPPDVADALAIALCHCYLSRQLATRAAISH